MELLRDGLETKARFKEDLLFFVVLSDLTDGLPVIISQNNAEQRRVSCPQLDFPPLRPAQTALAGV
jgi:hypothetical protein